MYKIIILYRLEIYNKYINAIKFEEHKGNIEVLGLATTQPYANTIDGYPMGTLATIMQKPWDYIVVPGGRESFIQMKSSLLNIGILGEKIFSMDIFDIPRFDSLPFRHKILFTPFECDLKSSLPIGMYNHQINNDVENLLYRNVNYIAQNKLIYYNPLKLFSEKDDFLRIR